MLHGVVSPVREDRAKHLWQRLRTVADKLPDGRCWRHAVDLCVPDGVEDRDTAALVLHEVEVRRGGPDAVRRPDDEEHVDTVVDNKLVSLVEELQRERLAEPEYARSE